jgi:hypothetical protein
LEVAGGYKLFLLSDVQNQLNPDNVTQGYFCDGKRYRVTATDTFQPPKISAGDLTYGTQPTNHFCGLGFLDVLPDGSFYLVRSDVVNESKIRVDTTIHYIGADGVIKGAARIPNSEFYIYVEHSMAINSKGEVFVLLPRLHSVDVLHLNFYRQLEPLIPSAAIPQITIVRNNP